MYSYQFFLCSQNINHKKYINAVLYSIDSYNRIITDNKNIISSLIGIFYRLEQNFCKKRLDAFFSIKQKPREKKKHAEGMSQIKSAHISRALWKAFLLKSAARHLMNTLQQTDTAGWVTAEEVGEKREKRNRRGAQVALTDGWNGRAEE